MAASGTDIGRHSGDDAAARVVALVLDQYRSLALEHVDGLLAGDAEDLHQFRVAIRQTRSIVSAGSDVLPADRRRRASAALKSMARLTSPVRDLDVYLGDLPELCSVTSGSLSEATSACAGLQVLVGEMRAEPAAELHAAVRGPAGAEMWSAWREVADLYAVGGDLPGKRAMQPARGVTDRWIRKAFHAARDSGRSAAKSDDLEHWHDLRKSLKRLRYLLAAFAPLHPKSQVRDVREHLRSLQERIGQLQDVRVQDELTSLLLAEAEQRGLAAEAALARNVLAGLDAELDLIHRGCLRAWSDFDTKATREAIRHLTH